VNEITIYNTLKGRHETVHFEFTPENTTWFDGGKVYRMADVCDGLLIQESGYSYPILIGDVSRSDISDNEQKALELLPGFDSHSYTKTGKRQHISQIQTE